MNDKDFIKNYLDSLLLGNASVMIPSNNERLNNIALSLYNIQNLNIEQQELLKNIIMICNIIYNRTDMEIPVISDGFYDLLNELYKKYDPNFQVGSAVITFKESLINNTDGIRVIESICPIHFRSKMKEKDELHQDIFNEITKFHPLNRYDYHISPIHFISGDISKRTHNTAHNHPTLVGTLDKAKFVLNSDAIKAGVFNDNNVKVLERDFFQDHISKGIINPNQEIEVICELKYDGISIEADCGLEVVSARTRGDTGIGEAADMTPILQGYTFRHAHCMINNDPIGVKFEAIITKGNLEKFNQLRGQNYKNGRTAIIGLFGSSDGYKFRDLITLVPLAIDREDLPQISNRLEEIEFLNKIFVSNGCPLRYCYFKGNLTEILYYIKAFLDEAKLARDYLDFMYDGIVVSYLDENIRAKLGRKNYINKYSMAVKFDPLEKQTTFRGYTYTVGQNGQITPMIHYDPVEFIGTIHTKSTGSSLDRFNELGLKYGDFINVTYVNDVMPYVSKLECDHNRNNPNPVIPFIDKCPICGSTLVVSDSGKTMSCINMNCSARSISRMTNMFAKLNIKGFAEATFKAIPEIDHFYKLFDLYHDRNFYVSRLGDADGNNMFNCLLELSRKPINDYIIIGALGFTGIAQKKWQSILNKISLEDLFNLYLSDDERFEFNLRSRVPNIGDVTCHTIAEEFIFFIDDIAKILTLPIINSFGNNIDVIEIRFTGCRNLQLSTQLNNLGYDADSNGSVTKKTKILIVPYEGFKSNKTSKVSSDCMIIPIDKFMANMNDILAQLN